MSSSVTRRSFLSRSSAAAAALTVAAPSRVLGANDRVTLGIIGTGGRGTSLLKTITNIDSIQIAAVCDTREDRRMRAAEVCEQYKPTVRQYENMFTMLDREQVDGYIVATEVGNHADAVVPVLERDLHCFSEKPLECTVDKVDRITRAARKSKGIFQVGFQRRYADAFRNGIREIREGAIGDVTFMQGHWHWPWTVGGWVADVEMSGGEIVEQACHHMDVMNWVMAGQRPHKCVAIAQKTGERWQHFRHDSEDQTSVTFMYANGAIFSYTHLFYLADEFTSEKLVVHGRRGGLDFRAGKLYAREGMGESKTFSEPVTSWELGTGTQFEAFVQHIHNNETPASNIETARISTLMSLMARKAMYDAKERIYEPMGVVEWDDLDTNT